MKHQQVMLGQSSQLASRITEIYSFGGYAKNPHFYVAEGLPQTQVLLWVYEDQLRAVVDSIVLAAYHCRYDGHTRHVRDIRHGIVYPTRFASPQGMLVPRHAEESLVVYRPKAPVVRVDSPCQRSNCGCSSSYIRPSKR